MSLDLPVFLQPTTGSSTYSAAQLRSMIDALVPTDGVTRKNDLLVSQRGAGANMSVDVASGQCAITGSSIANQGTYLARSTSTVNVAVAAAPGTGTRTDLICAQIYDDQSDSSGLMSWTPIAVTNPTNNTGTPPPTPVNAIPLAAVAVIAGHSSIVNANITDLRLLNGTGDVPLWELKGGNGQAVPDTSATTYTGWTFSELIGCDTNANPGEIVIRNPGRYVVAFTHRMDQGGTDNHYRAAYMEQVRSGSVFRRVGPQEAFPSAVSTTIGLAQTSFGTVRCNAGDVLRARSYQTTGATLHLSDVNNELSFSGTFVGP